MKQLVLVSTLALFASLAMSCSSTADNSGSATAENSSRDLVQAAIDRDRSAYLDLDLATLDGGYERMAELVAGCNIARTEFSSGDEERGGIIKVIFERPCGPRNVIQCKVISYAKGVSASYDTCSFN